MALLLMFLHLQSSMQSLSSGWSKPSTILFASEIPVNEKSFTFALAQPRSLAPISFSFTHMHLVVAASETSGIRYYDYAAAAKTKTGA